MSDILENTNQDWQDTFLAELIKIKHGYTFNGKYITTEKNDDILVTPGNFNIGGGFKSSKFKYFTNDYPKDYILKSGDIVVTMTDLSKESDTLGYSAKIPPSLNGERYLHNQRVGLVEFKTENVFPDFIYWLMRTKNYQGFIVGSASGTSIMHTSPTRICEYKFKLPPLLEQKAIAKVLSSLDDKIGLLHRQNQTLEAMAETLFRQWFVEEADESWGEGKLGDILSAIESGKRPKGGIDQDLKDGVPSIGAESINGIGNFSFSSTKYITNDFFKSLKKGIIKDYDVLIYKDGAYIGKKAMFGLGFPFKEFAINEHVFILRSNERSNQLFLYFLMQQDELAMLNANSAQPGLNQQLMKNFEIVIPSKSLITKFEYTVKPYIDKILKNAIQIRTLTNLRDTLLPKLIRGEIRVNKET